jgi:hypothetical protein
MPDFVVIDQNGTFTAAATSRRRLNGLPPNCGAEA